MIAGRSTRVVPALLTAGLLAVALAALPAAARAYFAPGAQIVSVSPEKREQADDSTSAVDISDDGRYVVFQTRARNLFEDSDPDPPGQFRVGGIFRRDLQTGALELVAPGSLHSDSAPGAVEVRGALNPSVSADGRYVAFSTGWQHTAADTNGNIDVYVRDMAVASANPAAYDLVSAIDGSEGAVAWAQPDPGFPGRNPGAEVTAGGAISADGRRVVFMTRWGSNLPLGGSANTAAEQLIIRDRLARSTELLTRDRVSGEPVGGAGASAVLSGDGSAVAWVGAKASAQVRLLSGEDPSLDYYHYLFRRLDAGISAETRRITGIADPDDPGCVPPAAIIDDPNTVRLGPCYGPLIRPEWASGASRSQTLAISGDGWRVAFITDASPRGPVLLPGSAGDVFVTNMSPGVSRKASTTELTREALQPGSSESVEGVSISPDGRWVALSSFRRNFVLAGVQQISDVRPNAGARELYLIDTAERKLQRVVKAWTGGDANDSVSVHTAISSEGRVLAFTSDASNLFFGDANGARDAFSVVRGEPPVASDEPPVSLDPPVTSGEEGPDSADVEARPLRLTARRAGRGRVRIRGRLPVAGQAEVRVRGRLPDSRGRPAGRARLLGSINRKVRKRGVVTIEVPIAAEYRKRLRSVGRITGRASVELESPTGELFAGSVTVQFRW